MYIENARIYDVTIVPTRYGQELELTLELQEGEFYTHMFNMVSPIENIATLCDVVGVQSYGELINTPIRVVIPDYGHCQIIGNRTYNKWVDLEGFTFMYLTPEALDILDTHKANNREREENTMKTNYNAEYIKGFLKGQEDRLRQRRLDPDYIETLVEQSEHLIRYERDPICLEYITLTFIEKISEHFYLGLNAKKYLSQTFECIDVADINMLRARAENAIGLVVIAGCTGDYPSITNQ